MSSHPERRRGARNAVAPALALALALLLSLAGLARAQADPDTLKCAKKLGAGGRAFTDAFLEAASACPLDNLADPTPLDCASDESTAARVADAADKLLREVDNCAGASLRSLCPFRSSTAAAVAAAVTGGAGSFGENLGNLNSDLLSTSYAPGCARPSGPVSRPAQDCAGRLVQATTDAALDLQRCYSSCEISRLKKGSGDACVDTTSGAATQPKALECIELAFSDLLEQIETRCDDATLAELGCPAAAATLAGLSETLGQTLSVLTQALNLGLFHSSCRGAGGDPGAIIPANVRLYPSGVVRSVPCGARLDGAFFGADTRANFESDLICSGVTSGTNGIVVAASGVELTGSSKIARIVGPQRSRYRTGTGILLAPGVTGVTVRGFKSIENFGVGIGDSSDSRGIVLENLTVRRDTQGGVRLAAPGSSIQRVTADRCGLGFDLSGDDTELRFSRARRSAGAPGIGVRLSGTDVDGDGKAVRAAENTIDKTSVGVVVEGAAHHLEQNDVRLSAGDGVQVAAVGARIEENSVKQNIGSGIVVSGSGNEVLANRCDENGGSGFVVSGDDNRLQGNGAGTLTDNGNAEHGFLVSGARTTLDTNKAEANLGAGFSVRAATALFRGNDSNSNAGAGFEVTVGGSSLLTNAAQANGGFELAIAAGNTDLGGNRANGRGIAFGAAGANLE